MFSVQEVNILRDALNALTQSLAASIHQGGVNVALDGGRKLLELADLDQKLIKLAQETQDAA